MTLAVAIVAIATLFLGFGLGAQVARTRGSRAADSARTERDAAMIDREQLRGELVLAAAERDRVIAERTELRAERDAATDRASRAEQQLAATGARLQALTEAETQLKDTFRRVSNEALQANQQQFLELADSRFRLAGQPISETLGKVATQLEEVERNRVGAQQALAQQIEFVRVTGDQLRAETAALVGALRKPQARGQWGELQLRRCVEYAGMLDRCDFTEQASIATADGVMRPDLIVHLVGGKTVVVDAKVTLVGYLDAHDAPDEAARAEHLARHARHLRTHVDSLAAKNYSAQFSNTPEFVIMFVPGDGPLNAALETDPTLLEYAISKRVHILGPMAFVPTLRTIAYAWQQAALADNAREVFDLGRELHKRLSTLGGHMEKLGRSLTRSVNDYNATVGSLESQVMSTARKLHDMKVTDENLPELTGLEDTVRPLTKPELLESAEAARAIRPIGTAGHELDRADDYGINVRIETERDRRTGS
jgi:DNA recombination protein RmuC